MSEMTRERVAAIRKSRAAAERELLRLCKNEELPHFSIPARPDADTDLIFRKALDDSHDLCTALEQAWKSLEEIDEPTMDMNTARNIARAALPEENAP